MDSKKKKEVIDWLSKIKSKSIFPISNPKYLVFAMVMDPKKIEET